MQRHAKSKFAAGDFVFPGGKLTREDNPPDALRWCTGLDLAAQPDDPEPDALHRRDVHGRRAAAATWSHGDDDRAAHSHAAGWHSAHPDARGSGVLAAEMPMSLVRP